MGSIFRSILLSAVAACFCGCIGGVVKEIDVVYGRPGGQDIKMDVFRSAEKPDKLRPAVILVHGGAWSAGDKSECHPFAEYLAKQGYVSFCIGYRLVNDTGNRWPAQLDDVQRAIRWIRANSAKYGVDPDRIGAIGGSAGGHIVACLGTSDTRDNSDPELAKYSSRPTCVVMMCGPTDLTEDLSKKVKQGEWCNEQIRRLLGDKPDSVPEVARAASPLFHVDSKAVPTLIVQGENDDIVPVDHAERFAEALKKAGVEYKLFVHKGGHGFDDGDDFANFVKGNDVFLKKHLLDSPSAVPAPSEKKE